MNDTVLSYIKAIGVIFLIYIICNIIAGALAIGPLGTGVFWMGYFYGLAVHIIFEYFTGE